MRKIIASINLTIDGFCDHTAGIPDEELHNHYTDLLNDSGVILYGRKTYELMEYWRQFLNKPSGKRSMDDFAIAINRIPKIVFSNTLKNLDWDSAKLADKSLEELISELRQLPGKDILIGSRSLIVELMNLNLMDELQLCIHPVIIGKGLPLFDKINKRTIFTLLKTKNFNSGIVLHHYSRI